MLGCRALLQRHASDIQRHRLSYFWRTNMSYSSAPGVHQTRIVGELWNNRSVGQKRSGLPGSVERSEVRINYPFSSDAALKDSYINAFGSIRLGRVLEDLDALAGNVAFAHCEPPAEDQGADAPPYHIVTASVDRIQVLSLPCVDDDMELSGRVNWVGRSSLEIGMQVTSKAADVPWLEANFTFVALRDGRAASITPLRPTNPAEHARFNAGATRAAAKKALRRRQQQQQQADASTTPHSAGTVQLDTAWLLERGRAMQMLPSLGGVDCVLMRDTGLSNCLIAQPQQRNTAGRVFGGFLMRRAFELAFATAYIFAGAAPQRCAEVDEVSFKMPVDLGNLVRFESTVLYSLSGTEPAHAEEPQVHVEVNAHVVDVHSRSTKLANVFAFTFVAQPGTKLRTVLPVTDEEAERIRLRVLSNNTQELL